MYWQIFFFATLNNSKGILEVPYNQLIKMSYRRIYMLNQLETFIKFCKENYSNIRCYGARYSVANGIGSFNLFAVQTNVLSIQR